MKRTLYPILQALVAAVLFGASAPFAKLLLGQIDPIPLAAFLYLGSGIGAWMIFVMQKAGNGGKQVEAHLSKADVPWLIGAILAGGVAAPILLMWGLNQTPASTASLLLNFESVATTLIAVLAFKEAVDRRILWAIGLITLTSILISWTGGAWGISLGAIGVIGACFLWGIDNNLTRHISSKNPLVIVGVKGLAAGTVSLLLTFVLGKPLPIMSVALLAMLLGSVCYGLSIQLFILAMRGLGAARTSTLFGIAPFVGTFLSVIMLHEMPQALFWTAVPVMLAGAWLMLTEHHDHHHIHESIEHIHAHAHDDHHEHTHQMDIPVVDGMHTHLHLHDVLEHVHEHTPDLHHRHGHAELTN
ncbi:MAG: DMT family transporter [Chloroflexi bacterium]|nr:DMT family transporter [Chloroflexota bacterium]